MLTKANTGKHIDWANIPLPDLAFGNAMDCDFTLRIYKIMRKELKEKHLHHLYDKLVKKSMVILTDTELNGMRVDMEQLEVLDIEMSGKIVSWKNEVQRLSPIENLNPNSPKELTNVLFSDSGFSLMPLKFSSRTGNPSTDKKDLQRMLYEVNQAIHNSVS